MQVGGGVEQEAELRLVAAPVAHQLEVAAHGEDGGVTQAGHAGSPGHGGSQGHKLTRAHVSVSKLCDRFHNSAEQRTVMFGTMPANLAIVAMNMTQSKTMRVVRTLRTGEHLTKS